ncbi:MAG TPA: ABC transporter substrate-binding protein [Pirellulaceae bacterium]|nr:ABC transporter substrate-binding protein [Pirellulaceae bacterium]
MKHRLFHCVGVLFACVVGAGGTFAADGLYLGTPYDEVTLDENNGNVLLKVKPLNLPGRRVPAAGARGTDLEVELLDRPGEKYKIEWAAITNVTLFEQMVLAEAEEHVKAGRYDEAYPAFHFLETNHPQTPGLKEAIENFLWVQIGGAYKAAKHDEALALLVELYERNPQRPGMNVAYERVTGELVKKHLADENYLAVRGLLRNLVERFPAARATVAAPYETQLQTKAAALLTEAKALLAEGKRREAHQTCSQMLEVWPAVAGGQELALSIHQQHPLVVVGVMSPLAGDPLENPGAWAAQRAGRLLGRPLIERTAAAGEHGPYRSALVQFAPGEDAAQLQLKVLPNLRGLSGSRDVSAHDVSRCLLAQADPALAVFDPSWADVFASVTVQSGTDLLVSFRQPQLHAAAWLSSPLFAGGGAAGQAAEVVRLGPYALNVQTPQQVSFIRQPDYSLAGPSQPAEVVERTYRDSAVALRALRRGEISVIDRISPWELTRLASSGDIKIEPYALPRVHVLLPNSHRSLTANRTFRRAIAYAIDNVETLNRGLLDGQKVAGCEALSGPFPRGPAYNEEVAIRPFDPGLAMTLARMTADEVNAARQDRGEPPLEMPPKLVLAHPAEPIARIACQSIARQLRLAGLMVTLREQEPGQAAGEDVDLLYADFAMHEPVVDAWRLLGPGGAVGDCSPAMLALLRSLQAATDEQQALAALHEIHRLAAAELPAIPLWQLTDHFAWHTSVQGIGQRPVTLYENIEQWQVEFRIPQQ